MNVKIPCPRCERPLVAPLRAVGKRVRCGLCGESFVLTQTAAPTQDAAPATVEESLPAGESAPEATSQSSASNLPAHYSPEVTVSRSMLMPNAGLQSAPPDAMICRLAPETLKWIDISAGARSFLGEGPIGDDGSFLDHVHPDDRDLARDEFRRAAELGERHELVLRLRDCSGEWHFVRLDAQARYDRDGNLNHVRCHFVDVTTRILEAQELRRRTAMLTAANEQLRQANARLEATQTQLVHSEKLAALGTLAAGMAHEINNPLAFASNNAAVLERETATVLELLSAYQEGRSAIAAALPELDIRLAHLEEQAAVPYLQEHLVGVARATRRGIQRVAQIVANLRAFAQLDRSELVAVDPNESLDQAIELLGELFSRHHIVVERDYAAVPTVECAAGSVNQVLYQLLVNAAHAIEDRGKGSGTIRVATRVADDEVVIEVADDGCGIPPEALPRIFEPFFTTKQVGRGTGLGLSISHGLIADHGGRIEAESTPGAGACFRLRLPRQPHAPA